MDTKASEIKQIFLVKGRIEHRRKTEAFISRPHFIFLEYLKAVLRTLDFMKFR